MINDVDNEVLQDDELFTKSFNDAMGDLQKSLGGEEEVEEELVKAKSEVVDEDEEEAEEEEDDEEEEVEKSMEDLLREDPEASAAMDVEPFLLQMVKAQDEINGVMMARIEGVNSLVKSIGQAVYQSGKLQKSNADLLKAMGDMPMPTKGVTTLKKSRFETGDENVPAFNKVQILEKSQRWLQDGKITLMDAGNIEGRLNKGSLGNVNDKLDGIVEALLKEEG